MKCKDYYWHLITNIMHTPNAITAWENIYTNFKSKMNNYIVRSYRDVIVITI